jgi:general secretion pathway protein L
MSTLILTLPDATGDAGALYDCVLSADGQIANDYTRSPLALLPLAGSAEVVAVVPAHRLSWHQVQLPSGSLGRGLRQDSGSPRVRALLEGLLEDRLLDETADLHFALAPGAGSDAPVWVAVCDRQWLRDALHTLEQSDRPAARVVPEFTPDLPFGRVHALGEPGAARLVLGSAEAGPGVWPLQPGLLPCLNLPDSLELVAEPAVAELAEGLFSQPARLQKPAERLLQAADSPWDLAQFDLVSSGRARSLKRWSGAFGGFAQAPRWQAARWSLLAIILVNLAGLNVWAWRENAALKARQQAVREVLTSTFPQVKVVVDAPLQMAREVAALQRSSGQASGRDLEALLGVMGAALPATAVVQGIDFTPGELRLRGIALAPQELSTIAFRLKAQGYALSAADGGLVLRQEATP